MDTPHFLFNNILKRMRVTYLFVLLAVIVSTNINAQVTIGSTLKPVPGAILDLKQFTPTVSGGENSYKGMMLPRINLVTLNSLKPTVPSPTPGDNETHIGLIVYNMASTDELCPGAYSWQGSHWERLYGTCETMSAQAEVSYIMEGLDRYFPFKSATAWTATVDDPDNILDQTKMALSGGASDSHNFKLQFNTVTDADKLATISFKDVNDRVLTVQINGVRVFLETSGTDWTPDVDAEDLVDAVSTNSIRKIKVDRTAVSWVSEKAGTVIGSTKSISVSANDSGNDRSGTVKFTLEGLESNTELNPSIDITQEKMTMDIELEWILKRPYGIAAELPAAEQIPEIKSLDNWIWGGVVQHSKHGNQHIMPAAGSESRLFLTTNSQKSILALTDGLPSWITITENPTLDTNIGKYVMKLKVEQVSLNEQGVRTGKVKMKVDGGLEKELTVAQEKSTFDFLHRYDCYDPAGNIITGDIITGQAFGQEAVDRLEGDNYDVILTNAHFIKDFDLSKMGVDGTYKVQMTPPGDANGQPKYAMISLLYRTLTGNYDGIRLRIIEGSDTFAQEIRVPVETSEDNPYNVALSHTMIDENLEVKIPQDDKEWLDIAVDNVTNTIQIKTLSLNLTGEDREAEVTMIYGGQTRRSGDVENPEIKKVKIVQEAIYLTFADQSITAAIDGGKSTTELSTNANHVAIGIEPITEDWLTATLKKDPIFGEISLVLDIKPNLTDVTRTYTITAYIEDETTGERLTKTITISQPAMTLALSEDLWNAKVDGETKEFTLSTNSYRIITAAPNNLWLTASVTKVSTGNYTTEIIAEPNRTGAVRTGTVTIQIGAGPAEGLTKTITVKQDPITLSLNPTEWTVEAVGGTKAVTVTTNSTHTRTATSDKTWLAAVVGADGNLTLTADAYTSTTVERKAIVTVTVNGLSKTLEVTQNPLAVELTVDPVSWAAPVDGGTQLITVTSNHGTISMISNAPSWLTVDADGKTLVATANDTGADRNTTVTVSNGASSKTVTVTQKAITVVVDPATWTVPVGGETKVFTVTTNSTSVPTVTNLPAWIELLTIGADKKVTLKAGLNATGAARTASVVITVNGVQKTITVNQEAIKLSVTPTTWNAPIGGGTQAITIDSNYGTVTVTSDQTWLTIAGGSMVASANTTGALRTATVTVSNGITAMNKTVAVSQNAITLTVTPATWDAPVDGGSQALTINSNHGTTTITSNQGWLTVSGNSIVATANATGADRTATATVSNGSISKVVTVTQKAITVVIAPSAWAAPNVGGTQLFTVTTNSTKLPTITSTLPGWLELVSNVNKQITLKAAGNITRADRNASVVVNVNGAQGTISITQSDVTLVVNPTTWAAPVQGGTQAVSVASNHGTIKMTSNQAWLTISGSSMVAAANTSGAARTATVTVSNGIAAMNRTIAVTQAAMTLTVTPASWAAPMNGGSQTFTATTNYGTVTMTSNQTWLTKGTDGKTFTAATNTTGASRTATITVTNGVAAMNKTITVTQATMTLTVTPASWVAPINGGSQVFTATTNHGTVTMTSNQAWLTKGTDGKTFTASANTTAASRTATITVSNGVAAMNKTVTVTQAAMTLTVTPASWAAPMQGGSQVFTATTNHGTVTMTSNQAWLVRAADGKTFTAAANTTGAARTATISVTNGVAAMNKTVTVTQAAMTLTVTPANWAAPVNGGSQLFTATSNYGTVTMTSNQAWLVRGTDGKTFTAAANTTAASRTATITVSNGVAAMNKTVTVTQAAMTLTVTPTSWAAPVNGGSKAFTATTNHGTVTMTSNQAWLVRAADGKTFTAAANTTGASRSATITVSNGVAAMNKTVTVTQAAMTLTVTPASWAAPINGGSKTFVAATNHGAVTMTSNQAWLVRASDGKTFTAAANTTGASRTATITVTNGIAAMNKTVTVTQATMTLTVTPATWAVPVNGGTQAFAATTNHGTITMSSNQAWLVRGTDGKTFTVAANTTGAKRSAVITVTNGAGLTKTVAVTQESMILTVTPMTWTAPAAGGSQLFTVTSNYGLALMSSPQAWLKMGSITSRNFTADPNTTGATRTGTIKVNNGVLTRTITVSQPSLGLTVTPAKWAASVDGESLTIGTNYSTVTMTSNANWVTVNSSLKRITAAQNTVATARTAVVTVRSGTESKTITVTQEGLWVKIAGMPTSWKVPINGDAPTKGTYTVTTNSKTRNPVADVAYGANYKIQNRNLNWMMCSANSTGAGATKKHTLTVRSNWYGNVTWGIAKTATLANRKATVTAKIGTVKAAQTMAVNQDGMYLTGNSPYVYLAYTNATPAWAPITNGQTKTLWVKKVKRHTWKDADMHMIVDDWFDPADGKFYSKFIKVWAAAKWATIDFGLICYQQQVVSTGVLNMYHNGSTSPWNAKTNFRYVKGQSRALPVMDEDGQPVAGAIRVPDYPEGEGGLEIVDENTGNILLIKRVTLDDGTVKDYSKQPRRRVMRIE